jgi:diketogulonate reductase-like aldo/keto reductase
MEDKFHNSNNMTYSCSNYDIFLTRDCLAYAKIKPAVNQIETHPYFQRDSLVKFCQKHGICVTAHTPLGGSTANTEWFGSESCLDDPVIKVIVQNLQMQHQPICSCVNLTNFVTIINCRVWRRNTARRLCSLSSDGASRGTRW